VCVCVCVVCVCVCVCVVCVCVLQLEALRASKRRQSFADTGEVCYDGVKVSYFL